MIRGISLTIKFLVEPLLTLAVIMLLVVTSIENTKHDFRALVRFCGNNDTDNRKLANCFGVYSDDNLIVANGECLRHSKIKKYHMYAGDPDMDCESEEGQTQATNGFLSLNEVVDIVALKSHFMLDEQVFWAKIIFPMQKDHISIYELNCFAYNANVKKRYEIKVFPCKPSSRDHDVYDEENICGSLKSSHPTKENLEFLPVLCDDSVVGFITNITNKTLTIRRGTEAERMDMEDEIDCLSYERGGGKEAMERMIMNMLEQEEPDNDTFVTMMQDENEMKEKCVQYKTKIKSIA